MEGKYKFHKTRVIITLFFLSLVKEKQQEVNVRFTKVEVKEVMFSLIIRYTLIVIVFKLTLSLSLSLSLSLALSLICPEGRGKV